ncbi:MAG TPA: hypothetical protein VJH24_01385 [Candidatus Bilamarchaeaceae archaeon]|nr:hypothetical protein [Candidatus Bilamarchaeaceae archaeon]
MQEVIFDFKEQDSKMFGKIRRPVADLVISNADKKALMPFYVDSGADLTLVPKSLGTFLDLKIAEDEITDIQGVGARQVPVILRKAKIRIGGKEIEVTIAWSLIEEVPLLLGRKDVFDNFEIIFKENKTIFRY